MIEEKESLFDLMKNQMKIKIKIFVLTIVLTVLISSFFGFFAGFLASQFYLDQIDDEESICLDSNEIVVKVVEEVSPAVVNIVVTKDVPIIEQYYYYPFGEGFGFGIPQEREAGTEKREVGGGSGFIVSEDGMILTNKHVVSDREAEYKVFTNDGRKFAAEVLARDPFQDLAVLKIENENETFSTVKLGDSSQIKMGQTVIAIGNALGEYRNTVSVGVISGLGRTITASGGGMVETLEDVIQTDAAINRGNSGGPLLNLKGEVIGINAATVLDAQNISFAIPINKAKRDIDQVKAEGKISYPFLGIYYTSITPELQEKYNLSVNRGAWIGRNSAGDYIEPAIFPDSPAEKIGLRQDDIILEFNNEKITLENSLSDIILKYNPGDEVEIKVLRGQKELIFKLILDEKED